MEGALDEVASELPVRLILNNEQLVTLLCTPSELEELAVGFLLSEGILREKTSLRRITVEEDPLTVRVELSDLPRDWEKMFEKRTISSGCGSGITFTSFKMEHERRIKVADHLMSLDDIRRLLTAFRNISSLYLETGGVHSAALSDGRDILLFSEDIGRHNAVDKVIGYALLEDIPLSGKIMLASGRLSSEIVSKCARCGIPVIISRAAPTSLSVQIAESSGLTLIGFARGDRMNIYSGRERITL